MKSPSVARKLTRFVAVPLALLSFAACIYAVQLNDMAFASTSSLFLLFANALPVVLLTYVLWALSKRLLLSTLVSISLFVGLQAINELKFDQLKRMLSTSDFALTRQVLGNLDLFLPYLNLDALSVAYVLLGLIVLALLMYFEPATLRTWKARGATGLASALLLISLLIGAAPWKILFSDQALAGFQIWSPDRSMQRSGLLAGLIRLGWQGEVPLPAVTEEQRQALAEFLQTHPAPQPPVLSGIDHPDLIVVQSESLFDPKILGQIDSSPELVGFWRIGEKGVSGWLNVPAYSGGTIQTEFEVLTGYPLSAFPGVDYPYYGLTDKRLPSLPMRLGQMGYRSMMFHPYERSFWNRGSAARWLGFSERYFERDEGFTNAPRRGPYISDDALFDATLKQLQQDRPQFAFLVTIENHGPWRENRPNVDEPERDAINVPSTLDAKARTELQTYLYHVRHGGSGLTRFAQAVLERPRPTLLLVYGDHLPSLGDVYDTLGFDNGQPAFTQDPPYVIAANYPLPVQREDLDAHQLPAYLMELMGLPDEGYFAISRSLRLQMQAAPDAETREQLRQLNRIAALESYQGDELPLTDAQDAFSQIELAKPSADNLGRGGEP